jgi:TetR/AcrR family transcriptional regulator, fatty acid biosynthesis regulator
MMTLRAEKKAKTRRALIEAALRLSAKHGVSGISLRQVALEAGLTPAAFYRHFRDMEDLGLALVDEVGISLRQMIRQARQRATERGRGVIRSSVEAFMEFVQDYPNLFRVLLGERSGSSPAFRKALHAEMDLFIGELRDDLEMGARVAKRPLVDTRSTAEAIVAVVFTVGAEALELPAAERKPLAERIAQEVLIIIRGAQALAKPC